MIFCISRYNLKVFSIIIAGFIFINCASHQWQGDKTYGWIRIWCKNMKFAITIMSNHNKLVQCYINKEAALWLFVFFALISKKYVSHTFLCLILDHPWPVWSCIFCKQHNLMKMHFTLNMCFDFLHILSLKLFSFEEECGEILLWHYFGLHPLV